MSNNKKCLCNCQSSDNLIYSCSGAADVGHLADLTARKLKELGAGKMFCLAAIGANIKSYVEKTKKADLNITIDGCGTKCAKKTFDNLNIKSLNFTLSELGFEKGKTEISEKNINKAQITIMKKILENS